MLFCLGVWDHRSRREPAERHETCADTALRSVLLPRRFLADAAFGRNFGAMADQTALHHQTILTQVKH